jgi:hypothetical protein
MDVLKEIQDWYLSNCNDDWEHQYGVKIGTLDNPGWSVEIDLTGTSLENNNFSEIENERSETDWIHCSIKDKKFCCYGGANNLEELLETFLKWTKSE